MASLLEEFIGIVNALNEQKIDYAVCGGWAMAIHGFLRATTDIDILILAEDLERVKTTAIELGFDIEGLPLNFDGGKTLIRRISKIDAETKTLITLDMILATEVYEKAWTGRRLVKWNNGEYRVVDTEGMIEMKERARRPKDLIDLEFLRGRGNES
ncbi:MAG TPA: hypothetical protein PLP21_14060 [Pyrinomonadaceae bacterium]|nr:hypothetical protein [Acidobacteriota bacterium]HQZ97441.1 hypothetical protein [Pyrinomonadaceae bacterium]